MNRKQEIKRLELRLAQLQREESKGNFVEQNKKLSRVVDVLSKKVFTKAERKFLLTFCDENLANVKEGQLELMGAVRNKLKL